MFDSFESEMCPLFCNHFFFCSATSLLSSVRKSSPHRKGRDSDSPLYVVICLQRIKRGHELCTVILADAQFIDLFHRFHQDAR